MVPRKLCVEGIGALSSGLDVKIAIGQRLPPKIGLEMFAPAIKPSPSTPGKLDRVGHSSIAAAEYSFEHAGFNLVALHIHAAQSPPLLKARVGQEKIIEALHPVPLIRSEGLG